MQLGKVED